MVHNQLTGQGIRTHTMKFATNKTKKRLRNLKRRQLFSRKEIKLSSATADTDYGIQELEVGDQEIMKKRKQEFLTHITKTTEEIIELDIKTRGQSTNLIWKEERAYRLTAS